MPGKLVTVHDKMQQNYHYVLSEPVGKNFHPDFQPDLTPKEMLELGIFGGKYMTDCQNEFPKSWFANAKLSPKQKNPNLNFFGVDASQPLSVWQKKAGFLKKIHEVGFSGTAATTWVDEFLMKICVKSSAGKLSVDTLGKLKRTVYEAM